VEKIRRFESLGVPVDVYGVGSALVGGAGFDHTADIVEVGGAPQAKVGRRLIPSDRLAPGGWFVNVQEPITTADSEPEPDIAVIRGNRRQYLASHPGQPDLALVVEVSDSSLQHDRTMKLRLYARAMIPIYWIVNLVEGRIEVYTDPTGPDEKPSYRQRRDYGPADEVPFIIEGRVIGRIAVRDLLP